MGPVTGVLALQGAFAAHAAALARCGTVVRDVRTPEDLAAVDALVLPGGESTTICKLLVLSGLRDAIEARLAGGMPVLGTCAGLIVLSSSIVDGRPDQFCLGAIDVTVRRNGFGRQRDSFETDLAVPGGNDPMRAVFIRAPRIVRCGESVEVVASLDGEPVLVRHGNALGATFHPELSGDDRIHRHFVGFLAEV
jgi:5'-phosphate synthase pdxT subunit